MPAVKACLLPGSETGWRDAGDACLQAEPICEALSLYHLLLSRDVQQGRSLTGLSQQPSAGFPEACCAAFHAYCTSWGMRQRHLAHEILAV